MKIFGLEMLDFEQVIIRWHDWDYDWFSFEQEIMEREERDSVVEFELGTKGD